MALVQGSYLPLKGKATSLTNPFLLAVLTVNIAASSSMGPSLNVSILTSAPFGPLGFVLSSPGLA